MTIAPNERKRDAPAALRLALTFILLLTGILSVTAAWGCGGATSGSYRDTASIEPEREDPEELESEQITLEEQLSEVMAHPDPNCDRACELGDAICDLRERICAIADRHPSDESTARRCTDGSVRCDAARERIAARCDCGAP